MSGALMDAAIAEVGSKAWQVQTLDTPASGQMECPEPISFSKFTSEAMLRQRRGNIMPTPGILQSRWFRTSSWIANCGRDP